MILEKSSRRSVTFFKFIKKKVSIFYVSCRIGQRSSSSFYIVNIVVYQFSGLYVKNVITIINRLIFQLLFPFRFDPSRGINNKYRTNENSTTQIIFVRVLYNTLLNVQILFVVFSNIFYDYVLKEKRTSGCPYPLLFHSSFLHHRQYQKNWLNTVLRYFFCFVQVNRNKEFVSNCVKYSGLWLEP